MRKKKVGKPPKELLERIKERIDYDVIMKVAELGVTDVDMGNIFGVSEVTINNWKKESEEFALALKKGKEKFDNGEVVNALLQRALGYSHDDVHISNFRGAITETDIIKYYPPDTTALIFWLKNRDPENWKDVKQIDATLTNKVDKKANEADSTLEEQINTKLNVD